MCFRSLFFYALVYMPGYVLAQGTFSRYVAYFFLKEGLLMLEVMFILAGVSAFLISLRSVLNIRGYTSIFTVSSGILALIFAAAAYDMYSVILLAISLCLTLCSFLSMLRDNSRQKKRMKRYINSSDYKRRRAMYYETERHTDIERHFIKNDRTD